MLSTEFNISTTKRKDIDRLKWLEALFLSQDEGIRLFTLGKKYDLIITFDYALEEKTEAEFRANLFDEPISIALNPRIDNNTLISNLFHEYYHLEQNESVGLSLQNHFSPIDALYFSRLMEGDAVSRAAVQTWQIAQKTGLDLKAKFLPNNTPAQQKILEKMTTEEMLESIFESYQKSTNAYIYDEDVLRDNHRHYDASFTLSRKASEIESCLAAGRPEYDFRYLASQNIEDFKDKIKPFIAKNIRKVARSI